MGDTFYDLEMEARKDITEKENAVIKAMITKTIYDLAEAEGRYNRIKKYFTELEDMSREQLLKVCNRASDIRR